MRVLVLVALLLVGCATPPQPSAETPVPTHEPNTVNVSVLLDLSGDRAPSGKPQRDAMQLWLDRPPPTATMKMRVKFVDVASSMSKLLLETRRAVVEDHADAIVVGVSVAGDESFAQAVEVARAPVLLTLPASEPIARGRGTYTFALAPTPETIARLIAGDIVDRGLIAPMLLATDDSPAAIIERAAFVGELARRGIAAPQAVPLDGTDGPTRIRLAAAVAKSAVFAGPAARYGDLIRPLAPRPPSGGARVYLSYLTETADLSNLRDASAYVTWPGSRRITGGQRGSDVGPAFLIGFADRQGQPSTLAGSAYDALTLIEAAAGLAPSEIDAARLRQRLEANTVAGAVTRYSFSPTRHAGFTNDDLALLAWDPQKNSAVIPATPITDR